MSGAAQAVASDQGGQAFVPGVNVAEVLKPPRANGPRSRTAPASAQPGADSVVGKARAVDA